MIFSTFFVPVNRWLWLGRSFDAFTLEVEKRHQSHNWFAFLYLDRQVQLYNLRSGTEHSFSPGWLQFDLISFTLRTTLILIFYYSFLWRYSILGFQSGQQLGKGRLHVNCQETIGKNWWQFCDLCAIGQHVGNIFISNQACQHVYRRKNVQLRFSWSICFSILTVDFLSLWQVFE